MKLRKGDTVEVITGKDKGKQGTILQVLAVPTDKVIVSGVNTASKHLKPGRRHRNRQAPQQRDQGGIVEIDMPIHASNVMYVHDGKPVRLGYQHRRQGQQGARRQARRRQDRGDRDERHRNAATKTCRALKQRYRRDRSRRSCSSSSSSTNVMQVPTLDKIVINMGVGRATQQPSQLEAAVVDLTAIAGQKPIVTKAKHSIAGFKLREGQSIGTKVTLRGDRMWEFLDRLIAVAIPRIRDFRGLPATSWDGRGNYTFGLNDQTVFPEIDYDKIDTSRGMDITIVTTATDDAAGKALLDAFGFPFRTGADAARGAAGHASVPVVQFAAASPPRGSRGAAPPWPRKH